MHPIELVHPANYQIHTEILVYVKLNHVLILDQERKACKHKRFTWNNE